MEQILKEILIELKEINSRLKSSTSDNLPDIVTHEDIMKFRKVGITKAYEILNNKEFTIVQDGKKKGIPKAQFLLWHEKDIRRKSIGIAK